LELGLPKVHDHHGFEVTLDQSTGSFLNAVHGLHAHKECDRFLAFQTKVNGPQSSQHRGVMGEL
ncbi:hypothetical protein OFC87_35085, partial [Escherichia coli]|nr:hypothetical protein [Escherichia coli]